MDVVIVESPAKAKTINKYLGKDYHVLASYGHVRDLPSKDGSVLPESDFEMRWEVDSRSQKRLREIESAVRSADRLILATDPDREGEAISWHVLEVLQRKGVLKGKPVQRVVFNAVTRDAVLDAMARPRDIDQHLVEAYLARRALDYLVGFTLSPVLWRKLPGARSAGRVQSVALRLVCDREAEIEAFVSQEYWSLAARLRRGDDTFEARLVSAGDEKLDRLSIGDEARAQALRSALEGARYRVASVESKAVRRNPQPPFTTSTLQQEASRKLGLGSKATMQIAQRLYEGVAMGGETQGLITYMRTDGVQIAGEAIAVVRSVIGSQYGDRYLPDRPRVYSTRARNAQEAHEAIRPVDMSLMPKDAERWLEPQQAKLYELIWKRTMASQMQSAEMERTTVEIEAEAADGGGYGLRATGSVLRFDGFLALYQEGRDDDGDSDDDRRLPALSKGEQPDLEEVTAAQHFTEPPPRFTEATLIKRMEELGIGRPSTYTATLAVLQERDYVRLDKRRLVPDSKGRLVTAFLESFFRRYVEYDFTADLEEKLDRISAGEVGWREVLREFWRDFTAAVESISDLRVAQVLDALNEILGPYVFPGATGDADPRACPSCADGRLSLKLGKFGAFIGCSNYPECRHTRQLGEMAAPDGGLSSPDGRVLGIDPKSGLTVTLRTGRFGPFVQLGEAENGEKPKRASLPRGVSPDAADLDQALALLSLPREVGMHPETGKPITAGIGRYGPFVQHEGVFANLPSVEEVFSVGLNRAVSLIAEKSQRGGRGGTSTAPLRELGEHAEFGVIVVRSGRYGPYVTNGKVNATLPRDVDPEGVTLDAAAEMISAKAEAGGSGRGARKGATAAKAAPKRKAAARAKTKPKAAASKGPRAAGKSSRASGE